MKIKGKEHSLPYRILSEHFEDLLQNRLPLISKKLGISLAELSLIIEREISPLDPHPGSRFSPVPLGTIVPDVLLFELEGKWEIQVNTSYLPQFHISPHYLRLLDSDSLNKGEQGYIRRNLADGQWLKRTVVRRNQTLEKIARFLLKRQGGFFEGEQKSLIPLTMKEVAEELLLNESTIARAVAHKFLACSQGLFPLKAFSLKGL